MKTTYLKHLFGVTVSILLTIATTPELHSHIIKPKETVYICKGPSSKRYHYDKYCQGLKNCSTDIYAVSKDEAIEMGRTLCGYED